MRFLPVGLTPAQGTGDRPATPPGQAAPSEGREVVWGRQDGKTPSDPTSPINSKDMATKPSLLLQNIFVFRAPNPGSTGKGESPDRVRGSMSVISTHDCTFLVKIV